MKIPLAIAAVVLAFGGMTGAASAHSIATPGTTQFLGGPIGSPANSFHPGHAHGHEVACDHAEEHGSVDFVGGGC